MVSRARRFLAFPALTALLLIGLAAPAAPTQPIQGMPLVLPTESIPDVRQLNPKVTLRPVLVSEPRRRGRGDVRQTAVIDVVTTPRLPRGAPFSLLLPAADLPVVQRLNQGVQIQAVASFKTKLQKKGPPTQIAQVTLTEHTLALLDAPPSGPLLVVGTDCLPALGQFNPGLTFDVLRFSQWGTGGDSSQTALLCLGAQTGAQLPVPPFPLTAPAADVTPLRSLNTGWIIDTVDLMQFPTGQGQVLPVAQVRLREDQQALDQYDRVSRDDDDEDDDDEDKDKDDERGKGKDKDKDKDHDDD